MKLFPTTEGEKCTEVLRAYWQRPKEVLKRKHSRIAFMQTVEPQTYWRGEIKPKT